MTVTLPRIDSNVIGKDGRFSREWYRALTTTSDTVNGILTDKTIYTDTGAVNAMVIASGLKALLRTTTRYISPAHTNTSSAVTLNDSGLGAKAVKFPDGSLPAIGQIVAGVTLPVIYDGVFWEIQNIQTANQAIPGNLQVAGTLQVTGASTLSTANLTSGSGSLTIGGAITRFESSEIAPLASTLTTYTAAHGGPRVPDLSQWLLRCKTAELGYTTGQEVLVHADAGDNTRAMNFYADATNLKFEYVCTGANAPAIRNASSGAISGITVGNWKLVARCLWL